MYPTTIQNSEHVQRKKPSTAGKKRQGQLDLKEQLKDRLYDKGVSTGKMPSIQRPNSEHMRPYTAKLATKLQKRQAQEQFGLNVPVQLITPTLPIASYREFAPGLIDADTEFVPVLSEQRGPDRPATREVNIGSRKSLATAQVLKSITGVTTIGSLGPSRGTNSRKGIIKAKQANQHFESKKQSHLGERHVMSTARTFTPMEVGLNAEEIIRSQALISKMSGKPNPDFEMMENASEKAKKPKVAHKRIWADGKKEQKSTLEEDQEVGKNSVEAWIKKLQVESEKEENEGAFVYLIQDDINDPYRLNYTTYDRVEGTSGRFYTLSKKGFTSYFRNEATEFLTIVEWIMERELYEQIKSFKFFKLFKLWRAIKLWRHEVINEKRKGVKESLKRKLMLANPGFAKILIEHRTNCRELEGQRLFDTSNPDEALSLRQFEVMQDSYMKKVASRILDVSNKTKSNFIQQIEKTLDTLKMKIREKQQSEEDKETAQQKTARNAGLAGMLMAQTMQQPESGKLMAIDAVYEHLGFQSNLSYANRTEVRKECKMFIRFSYLLDFIAKTSLKNMYINSMKVLDEYLNRHNDIILPPELPLLKTITEYTAEKAERPIILIQTTIKDKPVPEDKMKFESVDTYEKPPIGKIDENNFDPTCHLQLVEHYRGSISGSADMSPGRILFGSKVKSAYVDNPSDHWIKISPEVSDITKVLKQCLVRMLEVVRNYERHSKNEVLHPYASVLEEWDEKVADKWEVLEDKYLSCLDILDGQPEYENREKTVEKHMQKTQDNLKKYLNLFNKNLIRVWRYSRIPWELVSNDRLREPVDVITLLVKQIKKHKEEFAFRVPSKADLGFFKLNMGKMREKICSAPSMALKKMDGIMPDFLTTECDIVKTWLEKWTDKVQSVVTSAIKYVAQIDSMKYVEANMEFYVNKREIIRELISLCKVNEIKAPKDELYNELATLSGDLNRAMSEEKEKGDRRKEEFKQELKRMIETVKKDTEQLGKDINDPTLVDIKCRPDEILERMEGLRERYDKIKGTADQCGQIQRALEMEMSQFDILDDVKSEINIRNELWVSLREFKNMVESWKNEKFSGIDTNTLMEQAERHTKVALRCENRGLKEFSAVQTLKREVVQFKETMPVVEALGNNKLKPVHWKEIKEIIGTDLPLEEREFTLETLIQLNAAKHKERIHNISVTARQEYELKQQIKTIKRAWDKRGFVTKLYIKEQQKEQILIITDSERLFMDLDDTLTTLSNITGSRYATRLLPKANATKHQFDLISAVVDEWVRCQRNWLYLDSIFSSPDIRSHLKKETADFELLDKTWKQLAKTLGTQSKNMFFTNCTQDQLTKLQKMNKGMDKIKKELQNYLETKRKEFPRFYFLSDGELLPVMSKSTDITSAEPILPKCFDGLVRLNLGPNRPSYEIVGMYSAEEEHIPFKNVRMRTEDNVVVWLKQVEVQMVYELKRLIKQGYTDYFAGDIERAAWVMKHYAQVVSCVTQLIWTEMCEYSIKEMNEDDNALIELAHQNIASIKQLIDLIRGDLTLIQRNVIIALITTDVHWRDIIEKLATESITDVQDFLWQVQLRYYFVEGTEFDEVKISQVNSDLMYGYEYIGVASRLVVTPLTERCYLTITSALHIHLGASPAGPAGTGKTETVKDLSKALAIQCVVFNCSEQIEIKIMVRLFAGLAQQGAWTCLDEFNRIDVEVLSVIAQQVLQIRDALRSDNRDIVFNEIEMEVKDAVGIFVTMNPNYSGRTELPDNLKILFRPIAMMIPDYALIAEILLFAQGFQNAKSLALKMSQLYKLASEQLSQQDHYDFGMRAIKSVLVIAGSLKKREPELSEDVLLIRAMRDANVPKFLSDDLTLFLQLIRDLFPGFDIPDSNYGTLTKELNETLIRKKLSPVPGIIQKAQQLFESLNVRFGVMIIGPPGVGKTTCYVVLKEAMTKLREFFNANPTLPADLRYQKIETQIICPKAISLGELYGEESKDTKEWKYGIASKLMKKASGIIQKNKMAQLAELKPPIDESENNHWIVFDGPVDSKWIENMNSVLDDSRMLCLANAERIKLPSQMRMLFEVQDLACASLATVSRCGMVYISPNDIGWKASLDSWREKTVKEEELFRSSDEMRVMFTLLVEESVEKVVHYLLKVKDTLPIPVTIPQVIASFIANIQYWIKKVKVDEPIEVRKRKLLAYYAFATIWSFGGALPQKHYQGFDDVIRPMFPKLPIPFSGTVFDYRTEDTDTGFVRWKNWRDIVPPFRFELTNTFFSLFVPTADTEKYSYVMEQSVDILRPAFFTGETGVGKSLVLRSLLMNKQTRGEISIVSLVFSATTSSLEAQLTIESKLEPKKFKKVLGPQGQTKGVIFIDDINMPIREVSGAQPPIELLRQYLNYGGFYGRVKPRWIQVVDTTICCAGGPPGGGRNALSPRFTQLFNLFCIPEPSEETLRYIFENILMGFLVAAGFPDAVRKMGTVAVGATIELYSSITTSKSLKPTPSKFHYIYNLRDLSKVFQCMLMTNPKNISSAEIFTRLWIHECMRIFGDRLVTSEDVGWIHTFIASILSSRFRYEWTVEDMFVKKTIMFTDIYRLDYDVDERPYEEIMDIKRLVSVLNDALLTYNEKNLTSKMDLVFFDDAICYIARIARTLRQKRGSCLLIGVSGCGKESYTMLASSILNSRFFKIRISKNYRRDNFKDDVKTLMKETGIDGKSITFMMNDNQLTNETFLEDINSVLNTGEINNLFKNDEMDAIIQNMGPVMQKLKRIETKELKYTTFLERIRDNLHIVLSMSPIGESFRSRCRKFPSLINCCTLIYFDKWPGAALRSVCAKALGELGYMDKILQNSLTTIFPLVHLSVEDMSVVFFEELRRKFYVTPKSYIDAIKFFTTSLENIRDQYTSNIERLSKGLKNFHATTKMVEQLQDTLTKLRPIIEENTLKANKSLAIKEVEAKKVEEEELKIENEKNLLYQQQTIIEVSRAEAMKELDAVQPLLDEAKGGLDSLDPRDITNIRTYTSPPKVVINVMQAVLVLLENGKVGQDWGKAKIELLQGANFIKKLINLDYRKLSESTIKFLKTITCDFVPEEIKKGDPACVSMATWCNAMQKCYDANKKVAPQEEKLHRIEAEYKKKMAEVKIMEDALEIVKQKLRQLEAEHRVLSEEAKQLNDKKEKTTYQLANAEQLISLLGTEGERWGQTIIRLKEEEKELVGNIFLSAVSISYIAPFTMKYRQSLLSGWQDLCRKNKLNFSPDYSIIKTLGNQMELKRWNVQGLPADHISMENGILATKTHRWPLMIDPEGQANKWIKNLEKANDLIMVKMGTESTDHIKAIDRCVQGGIPLLLEDVQQEFDSSLYTVLGRKTFKSDVGERITFGEKDIPYDPHFRLYLTCKQSNPHFLPEICIMLSVINFAVTFEALEEQLLVDVIVKEKPEVEAERTKRITEIATYQKKLIDIEADILEKLTNTTEETILNNVDLIVSLETSKKSSIEIEKNIKEAVTIEAQVNKAREQYREIATRGAILYFVLVDIGKIDPMYQYSFVFLKALFNDALNISESSATLEEKKLKMISNITKVVYRNICRGLFEIHKLVFSFLIASQISLRDGKIKPEEWDLFIRGAGIITKKTAGPLNPLPSMITDLAWNLAIAAEEKVGAFIGMISSITQCSMQWMDFANLKNPYSETKLIPSGYGDKLSTFQRLILVKILKSEKVRLACTKYVEEELGSFYTDNPSVRIDDLFADSNAKTPIIFVLSQGADPTEQLKAFARENKKIELEIISLGKEQELRAEKELNESKKQGRWLMLQNCHLAKSFMPKLESLVSKFEEEEQTMHANFRLLLSSMPADYFPISVLQNGLKYTTEPPAGIRANMSRTYNEIRETEFDGCKKAKEWKTLLYGMAMFHAVVQERRKFGPLGWNVKYEFNETDLATSKTMLFDFLETREELSWDALCFVTGHINYGGRVTDDWDRKLIICLFHRFLNQKMIAEEEYVFTESGTYILPKITNLKEYQEYIIKLPEHDEPEIFGMHDNADITYETRLSDNLLNNVLQIQPKIRPKSAGRSNDDIVLELVKKLKETLPEKLEKEKGLKELFSLNDKGMINSLSTVLVHEIEKYNNLLSIMSSSLEKLEKAVTGEVVMSQELDDMYTYLLMFKVPPAWKIYDSLKSLGSWYPDLGARVTFIKNWIMGGVPSSFRLSAFVFPQGFLTGALQAHARQYQIPIDLLSFDFQVTPYTSSDQIKEAPKEGIYITGLYLEGAAWNQTNSVLEDPTFGQLYIQMNVINFIPIEEKEAKTGVYECPVYKTAARQGVLTTTGLSSNYVIAVDLPCEGDPAKWTLRGAALLTELIN